MSRKSGRLTEKQIIERIKMKANELGRPPLSNEVGRYVAERAKLLFGSFPKATEAALGKSSGRETWTKDTVIAKLKEFRGNDQMLPAVEDVRRRNSQLVTAMRRYFSNPYDAFEEAYGCSQRTQIVEAIRCLTPPGCPEASTFEIQDWLQRHGHTYDANTVARHTWNLVGHGLVTNRREGRTTLYSLTDLGQKFSKGERQ